MKMNLERGGIIRQAQLHMATADHVVPLDEDAGEFQVFATDMTNARFAHDRKNLTPILEYSANLALQSKEYPLGRVARIEKDLPTGKRLNLNLAILMNEAVFNMPEYSADHPDVRKIGRANFFLRNADQHTHIDTPNPRFESILQAGFDILSDGSVNTTIASLEACKDCLVVRLHDDARIIGQLGLNALFYNRAPLPEVSSHFGPYSARTSRIVNEMLDDEQVSSLQGFLMEQFKPTAE
jgi:hypothetical protein